MGLKGLAVRGAVDVYKTSFRSSWTRAEGATPALIHEARVIDVNVVNWTVDVTTIFDQKRFFDVQVASPYMHSTGGEGIYVMPEVGAKCYVCIPSDGPPPFILGFIMPLEAAKDEASEETSQPGGASTAARFGGGRPKAKPGDIILTGRDGNFMKLHRGGVAEFGAGPLAQRICIPLGNLVTDISQNYNHFNTGGSINWGVSNLDDSKPETEYKQTFRVYANDKFADVRTSIGKVRTPVPEPAGKKGSAEDMADLMIAQTDAPIVYEVVVAPGGFDTDAGYPQKNAKDLTTLRFLFDRKGGVMLRSESSVSVRVKKRLRIKGDEGVEILSDKDMRLETKNSMKIFGGDALELGTDGGVAKINGGTKPVAHVGSIVKIVLPIPLPITTSSGPGTITAGAMFEGIVSTGNPTILV